MAKLAKITAVRFPSGETYRFETLRGRDIEEGRCEALRGKDGEIALHEYRRAKLLELVPVKSTLTVVCTYRSSSGMSARFRVFVPIVRDGKPIITEITGRVAELCGMSQRNGEIVMSGSGYSKSFQIGYNLGCALWPNGTPEPHGTRNGVPDTAGGYAISVA